MDRDAIKKRIKDYLREHPDKSAREILRFLASEEVEVTKKQVNNILYTGSGKEFEKVGDLPPRWKLILDKGEDTTGSANGTNVAD